MSLIRNVQLTAPLPLQPCPELPPDTLITVLQVESTWPINILKLLGPGSLITQQGPKHTSQRRIMSQVGSHCCPDWAP